MARLVIAGAQATQVVAMVSCIPAGKNRIGLPRKCNLSEVCFSSEAIKVSAMGVP